jgi:hypothetical protein
VGKSRDFLNEVDSGQNIRSQTKIDQYQIMKKTLAIILASLSILLVTGSSAFAGDLEDLAGKWSVKKTNDQGQAYTQTLEVKKDKFTFKILGADDKVVLYATGDVKLEKLGPFKSVRFANIQAGASADNLDPVADDRVCIYTLSDTSLSVASNFDKERDNGPVLDVYSKATK